MRNVLIIRNSLNVIALTTCVLLLGCSTKIGESRSDWRKADAAVVEFLVPVPSLTYVTADSTQVAETVSWLERVRSTQLPSHEMGPVHPWCKITLITLQGAKQTFSRAIYSKKNRETELLTAKQREELLNVFNLEEVQTEPYIREKGQ